MYGENKQDGQRQAVEATNYDLGRFLSTSDLHLGTKATYKSGHVSCILLTLDSSISINISRKKEIVEEHIKQMIIYVAFKMIVLRYTFVMCVRVCVCVCECARMFYRKRYLVCHAAATAGARSKAKPFSVLSLPG